ncbi:MAG: AAA family ATPase [Balneolaceae bacterium]
MIQSNRENNLVIVGGPNGAGKTTLANEILLDHNFRYISADEIAQNMSPSEPESVKIKAGKEFYRQFEQAFHSHENILIESTLSGKSVRSLINKVILEGSYSISIIFVFLTNPQICAERIKVRVKKGGHDIPEEDIYRRFGRSIVNFWQHYRFLSDHWSLYYNSDDTFLEVLRNNNNDFYVLNETLFATFKKIVKKYEQ